MANSGHEEIVTLAYGDTRFRFAVTDRTEARLEGYSRWTEGEKARCRELREQEDEEGKQPWYLDDDGWRLDDEALFRMNPWTLIDGETRKKVVNRLVDQNTGKAWFDLSTWFGVGDELNRRPT